MKKSKRPLSLRHLKLDLLFEYRSNDINSQNAKIPVHEYRDYLLNLLFALDGVIQSPEHHPESDALFHTLQVFELAHKATADPELWLAALFHDVGKSAESKEHAHIGADMVAGILPDRVVWLIEHHLDIAISPQKTRQELANTRELEDLILLRNWDLAGRSPTASVPTAQTALDIVFAELANRANTPKP